MTFCADAVQQRRVDQTARIDHHICTIQQAAALEGKQFRVAWACAHKVDGGWWGVCGLIHGRTCTFFLRMSMVEK